MLTTLLVYTLDVILLSLKLVVFLAPFLALALPAFVIIAGLRVRASSCAGARDNASPFGLRDDAAPAGAGLFGVRRQGAASAGSWQSGANDFGVDSPVVSGPRVRDHVLRLFCHPRLFDSVSAADSDSLMQAASKVDSFGTDTQSLSKSVLPNLALPRVTRSSAAIWTEGDAEERPWVVLGIAADASPRQVRKAYRAQMKKIRPSGSGYLSGPARERLEELAQAVQTAHDVMISQ